jgi:hypothetical protein
MHVGHSFCALLSSRMAHSWFFVLSLTVVHSCIMGLSVRWITRGSGCTRRPAVNSAALVLSDSLARLAFLVLFSQVALSFLLELTSFMDRPLHLDRTLCL